MKDESTKTLNFNDEECPKFLARELIRKSKAKEAVDESPLKLRRNKAKNKTHNRIYDIEEARRLKEDFEL